MYIFNQILSCVGDIPAGDHQHRHNRARGARQVHGGESVVRGAHRQVQERAGEEHHHQARLR